LRARVKEEIQINVKKKPINKRIVDYIKNDTRAIGNNNEDDLEGRVR